MALSPIQRRAAENALRHARAITQVTRHAIGLEKELEKLLAADDPRPAALKETSLKTP